MRLDWLAASVCAICLLKTNRPALAGVLLGYASVTRLFEQNDLVLDAEEIYATAKEITR